MPKRKKSKPEPHYITPAERLASIKQYFKDNHIPFGYEPMTFEFNAQGDKPETDKQRDRRLRREAYLEKQEQLAFLRKLMPSKITENDTC